MHCVVGIALIEGVTNALKQVFEVVVCDRKFIEKSVEVEEFKSEVQDCLLIESLTILEYIELPLVKVFHELTSVPFENFFSDFDCW
jgi:hypothetical protein